MFSVCVHEQVHLAAYHNQAFLTIPVFILAGNEGLPSLLTSVFIIRGAVDHALHFAL